MTESAEVSIVVPVFNEEEVLPEFLPRLKKVAEGLGRSYELVFVDDGSTDRSLEVLKNFKSEAPTIRLISFTRNFGQQAAVLAGFRYCRGKVVVQIDADLQNPPEEIPKLLKALCGNIELVTTVPRKRRDNPARVLGSSFLHGFAQLLFGRDFKLNLSSFRAMRRSLIEKIKTCKDRSRYMAVLMSWMGVPAVEVEVDHHNREVGKTKYSVFTLIKLTWDLITGYSTAPLRMVTYLGLFGALMGFFLMMFLFYQRIVNGILIEGFIVLSAVFAFFSGVQLLTIGFLGEYLGRVHLQIQNRPDYIISKVLE